jgi:hypothetical protein
VAENLPGSTGRPVSTQFEGLPLDAVRHTAALFGTTPTIEPYAISPEEPVYAIAHRSDTATLRIVCWPALQRVDVRAGPHYWVAKSIVQTTVIDGIEVMFRTAAGAILFVAVNGDVMMVSS